MGKSRRIRHARLFTAVTPLNDVRVIRDRLSGVLIDYLQPVSEMHRHRQQPTKCGPSPTLADDHRARATDHDIAMPTSAIEHRGITTDMIHLTSKSVEMRFDMPLAELILDFFDQLKSRTKGYASLDYEFNEYRPSELVKLDILLSGDEVDALSFIVHKDKAYGLARGLCDKLKEIIPRQLFEVPIQGAIGNKIIARSTVKARRKDVLAKCYGGDISRKRKLLEKQKEGKKRMKAIGSVEVPQEAFMAILKVDE